MKRPFEKQLGAPEDFANDDRPVAVGGGYFWLEREWKPKGTSVFPSNIKLGQNIAFLEGGTVLLEASEIFVRLGAADIKETDGIPDERLRRCLRRDPVRRVARSDG